MAAIIFNVLLLLDGAIYNLIDYLYDIFDFLAKINIFGADDYNAIVSRIYVILGLFMLFVLAYSLLKAVINPDDFAKGENSFPNLIKNVVISLAIIILLPTVFTVIFNIQNSILNNDTIPKLILGTDFDSEIDADAGRRMAYYTFTAFFHENETWCESNGYSTDDNTCADHIAGNGWLVLQNGPSLSSVRDSVMQGTSFTSFSQYGEAIDADQIDYMFLISTVAGIFILYVLLNFCFDLAIRVIKLAFYQIIAPIPVICRILPGGKMKDVFSKWTKQVISIFLEVFIRIGIMYLGIFLITLIIDNFGNIAGINSLPLTQKLIVQALLIMGVIIFIRQAPKLLGELLNLDTGGMKLGLMDKLAMGGGLLAGAAAGGLVTGGTRNFVSAFKGKGIGKDFKSGNYGTAFKKIGGSIIPGVTSGIAGAGSAMVRSGYGAKGAKNLKDMAGAAHAGAAAAGAAKAKRDAYKASHGNILQVGAGHITDAVRSAGDYFGFSEGFEALNREKGVADEMMGFYKTMAGYVEDNEMVANYAGLYDAEMKKEISSTVFDSDKYQEAVNARMAMYRSDNRYSSMDEDTLRALASSEIDRNQYTRERTAEEMGIAIQERQERLKMYDNLKKMATIKAINEKLNDKTGDIINDGRFQAIVNQVEVFKKQNSTYDFVQNMNSIAGVQWDESWNDIMNSGNAKDINDLMKEFKATDGSSPISFFGDSEIAKNKSGAVSAEIAKKVQEKKEKDK